MLYFFLYVSYFYSTFVEVKVHLCPTGGSQLHHRSEICFIDPDRRTSRCLTSCCMKTAGRSGREEINNHYNETHIFHTPKGTVHVSLQMQSHGFNS